MVVKHKRNNSNNAPQSSSLEYGEIAINYKTGGECIYIKNDSNQIVEFTPSVNNSKTLVNFEGTSITLSPNVYYRQLKADTHLAVYLGSEKNTSVLNEYLIEFTTALNGTTISLPNTIKWANGEIPTFENDTTYQISIVNNLGVCIKFK